MRVYALSDGSLTLTDAAAGVPFLALCQKKEAGAWEKWLGRELPSAWREPERIPLTKCAQDKEGAAAMFSFPSRPYNRARQIKAFCFVKRDGLLLIAEREEEWTAALEKLALKRPPKLDTAQECFVSLLEVLMEGDAAYLEELENRLARQEDSVLAGNTDGFQHRMSALRKELMALAHHYRQLGNVASVYLENDSGFWEKNALRSLRGLERRLSALMELVQSLREDTLQVQSLFQGQVGIRQNKIMKALTVITTIFMPLTLLTGWYGMNFTHMPELDWAFGYPLVIGASLLVAGLCAWALKRKRYF